jgi:prepilin-type processing-associated H-X9-DG protein
MRISVFLCPSDPISYDGPDSPGINYLANSGVNPRGWWSPMAADGVFYKQSHHRFSDLVDGASHTAVFSESRKGDENQNRYTPNGDFLLGPTFNHVSLERRDPAVLARFADACEGLAPDSTHPGGYVSFKQTVWYSGSCFFTLYSHLMPPNHSSCVNGEPYYGPFTGTFYSGSATTAGSYHPGGANVVLADGSVHFVKETISRPLWWDYGTRAGGEIAQPLE